MPEEKRKARVRIGARFVLLHLAVLGAAGIYLWCFSNGRIPDACLCKRFLHLYCPGCGGTRAATALLHGQVGQSLLYNPTVLALAGTVLYYDAYAVYAFVKGDARLFRRAKGWVLIALAGVVILQWVARNILLVAAGWDPIGDLLPYWK